MARLISPDIAELALMITGGVLVVGAVVYARKAVAAPKLLRKRTGITVKSDDCRDWSLDNVDDYHATVKPVYDTRVQSGVLDPWMIADSVMGRVVPTCRTLDDGARNPQEALLQYLVFLDIVVHLENDEHITASEAEDYSAEIYDYAIEHGVSEASITEATNSDD